MTIRLPLDHPGLLALPKAEMVALVFPGGGTATGVEKADRSAWPTSCGFAGAGELKGNMLQAWQGIGAPHQGAIARVLALLES